MKVLGLLVAAAVVFGLVLFGVDKLNEPGPTPAEDAGLDVTADPSPPPVAAGAAGEACLEAHRDITAAERTYFSQYSRYADIATLVRAGNLVAAPTLYIAESSDGWATYRLVGQAGCP
jgi:hypothetical protein